MTTDLLSSWRDGPTKQAIINFVERTGGEDGSAAVPVEERVAVFDNDGTLWCEKPMPIQLDFILRRLMEMAEAQPELRERQVASRPRARLRLAERPHDRALRGERHQREDVGGGHPGRLRRHQRRSIRGAGGRLPTKRAASDPRSPLSGMRLRTNGRAVGLPGGQRILELHRVRRWTRFHAAHQPGRLRHPT